MVNLVIDYMQLQMITCKFNNFIAHNSEFLSILRIHFIQLTDSNIVLRGSSRTGAIHPPLPPIPI